MSSLYLTGYFGFTAKRTYDECKAVDSLVRAIQTKVAIIGEKHGLSLFANRITEDDHEVVLLFIGLNAKTGMAGIYSGATWDYQTMKKNFAEAESKQAALVAAFNEAKQEIPELAGLTWDQTDTPRTFIGVTS